MCFIDYHDDAFSGLVRDDSKINNAKKSEWTYPIVSKKKENPKNGTILKKVFE